jgi:FAD/FMN-containing dehydrogenase
VIQILSLAKTKYLTEVLAAFEFMDHDVLGLVEETHGGSVKLPVGKASYSVLIETHGSNQEHDQDKLAAFLESIMEKHLVMDGVLAQNLGQVDEFWKVRDMCNPAAAATGFVYKYDISLAAIDFDSFIQEIKSQLASFARKDLLCVNWGHLIGMLKNGCGCFLLNMFLT